MVNFDASVTSSQAFDHPDMTCKVEKNNFMSERQKVIKIKRRCDERERIRGQIQLIDENVIKKLKKNYFRSLST